MRFTRRLYGLRLDGHCCKGAALLQTQVQQYAANHPDFVEGVHQGSIGIAELSSAVATGGATLELQSGMAVAVGIATTAGLGVSGTTRIIATTAGEKSENIEQATTAITTITNPAGLAMTVGTGGNLKAGAIAADVSSAKSIVANPAEAMKDPTGTGLTVGNIIQDVNSGISAMKTLFSPPTPPHPPLPPAPSVSATTQKDTSDQDSGSSQ